MATERLPMRKVLEILRLRWVLGLTVRETSAALGMSTGAVSRTTERAHAAALSYEAASALTHEALEAALYPVATRSSSFVEPDVRWIHRELRRVGVTLELLHQEYRAEHGERALGYSAFCRRYQRWRAKRGPVLRKHYVGGEVLFGARTGLKDPKKDGRGKRARFDRFPRATHLLSRIASSTPSTAALAAALEPTDRRAQVCLDVENSLDAW
jgi:hypothetical protein